MKTDGLNVENGAGRDGILRVRFQSYLSPRLRPLGYIFFVSKTCRLDFVRNTAALVLVVEASV
jgi:hypothetical protein